jgi:hypothetical protein
MATLRRDVAGSLRTLARIGTNSDLDPLRSGPDFQALMMDLTFPPEPFARWAGDGPTTPATSGRPQVRDRHRSTREG